MQKRRCSRCGCYLSGFSVSRGWTMCMACEPYIEAQRSSRSTGCKSHGYAEWDQKRRECGICKKDTDRMRQAAYRAKKRGQS